MPAYTPPVQPRPATTPSSYDLSRRATIPSTLEDATIRVSNRALGSNRVSSVPKPYGSSTTRGRTGKSNTAVNSRREALSRGLRDSGSVTDRRKESTAGIAKTYAPSRNADRSKRGRAARTIDPDRVVVQPGTTRREAVDRIRLTRESQRTTPTVAEQNAKRIENARAQAEAKSQHVRRMRSAYQEATREDPDLRKRMENISRAINQGTNAGIRAGVGAARSATGSTTGSGTDPGDGQTGDGDQNSTYDDGYYDDGYWDDPYYGCNSWYWNCFFPNFCHWGFGYWGWGFGSYGYCHSSYYWPYYSSYGYYGYKPAYGYCSPAIVYNYTVAAQPIQQEQIIYVETPAATTPGPAFAQVTQGAPRQADRTFGARAATEYMNLGDRAFTEGRYGDAVHYYAKSIQFAPEDGVLYLVLSDALFATGDYHYAAFALRRALEFNPELAALGLDKRSFYGQAGEFDKQLATLAKFVADHPIDRDARLVLAANYLFSLNAEEAVKTLDGAPGGANPNSKASHLLLAAGTGMLAK